MLEPSVIRLEPDNLTILWKDGHASNYNYKYLRFECRCAQCINEWTRERVLSMQSIPNNIKAEDYLTLGNYAIQILWSDLHQSGIYSYTLLRELCRCAQCVKKDNTPTK